MSEPAQWFLCIFGAYLVGSIPFGLLIGLAKGVDIRQHGSKNIGATNAGRVLGRKWGYLAFGLDALKGFAPVFLTGWCMSLLGTTSLDASSAWLWLAAAAATVAGHIFPIWLKFKGGKGVATGFGALAGMWGYLTIPALCALIIWILTVRIWRYVSISSCIAALSIPLSITVIASIRAASQGLPVWRETLSEWPFLTMTTLLALVVVWKHRANFARLRAGSEPKIR